MVLIFLVLTLRPIVAWWVAVGIATAYAGAFIFLPSVGVSLNMLSTFAFLLVLGIVVDDAIVVGEGIHSEAHRIGGGVNASIAGAQLVAKPVIFGVLTTDTAEQAIARSGGETGEGVAASRPEAKGLPGSDDSAGDSGNAGYDAGNAAVEMANLLRGLDA